MGKFVPVDKVAEEVKAIINDYADDVTVAQREVALKVAMDCANELRGAGSFNGTKYRGSWTFRPETIGRRLISFRVYNAKHYRLTHLLERGHVVKNQHGPTGKSAQAFPHVEPIEQKYVKEFEEKLKTEIHK